MGRAAEIPMRTSAVIDGEALVTVATEAWAVTAATERTSDAERGSNFTLPFCSWRDRKKNYIFRWCSPLQNPDRLEVICRTHDSEAA